MIAARTTRTVARIRRTPAAAGVAALLTIVGVVLLIVASCSSQPGAPQPTAAQAGTIDATTTGSTTSSSAATTSAASETSAPSVDVPSSAEATTSAAAEPTPDTTSAPASSTRRSTTPPPAPAPAPPSTPDLLLPAARPIAMTIPAIGASSTLLDLGLNPDNTIQVPPVDEPDSKAGWYNQSPMPGSIGPAILVGHIDSAKYGPGIFYNLGKLDPGDTIEVTRDDNTVAIFAVDGVRTYPKAEFPTKEVYGNLDHAGLRLITCGGAFNSDTGHYEDNTIVFASLISSRSA